MYKVYIDRRVVKQINALHPCDANKVTRALDKLGEYFSTTQDIPNLKKLSAKRHAWRLRLGNVRILFYQNEKQQWLEVYKVGYRGGIYK
ncbi:hypothetical protein KKB83_05355 [Patescibacteria group bacterium]|nr:hypothetical protein [Patescibacteria group bacterium]